MGRPIACVLNATTGSPATLRVRGDRLSPTPSGVPWMRLVSLIRAVWYPDRREVAVAPRAPKAPSRNLFGARESVGRTDGLAGLFPAAPTWIRGPSSRCVQDHTSRQAHD